MMSDVPAKTVQRPVETDPRFPSGRWVGFWLQRAFVARQHMSLSLSFSEGRVIGEGADVVGDFDMNGTYDLVSGNCSIVKTYRAAHRLTYEGRNDGDGLWIWGVWHMSDDRGGFHFWPEGEEDPTGRKLRAQKEVPLDRPRVRLVPVGAESE
jgi:hypothetical protein